MVLDLARSIGGFGFGLMWTKKWLDSLDSMVILR
jgi:hypothetical protein